MDNIYCKTNSLDEIECFKVLQFAYCTTDKFDETVVICADDKGAIHTINTQHITIIPEEEFSKGLKGS